MKFFIVHCLLFISGLLLSATYAVKGCTKNMDITPQTEQQEVDLVYYRVLSVHKSKHADIADCTVKSERDGLQHKSSSVLICKERVSLLRGKKTVTLWQKENRLHGFILLDMPEMGIHHVKAHIIAVKTASEFNGINISYSTGNHVQPADSVRPVTGVFIRHVTNVSQYVLQSIKTGRISTVNATPEHRFYVSNRQAFIPISEVSLSDRLITDAGDKIRMIAVIRDGEQKQHNDKGDYSGILNTVYNLEVSKKHTYFAGNLRVFVHNPYGHLDVTDPEEGWRFKGNLLDEQTVWGYLYRRDGTLQFHGGLRRTGYYQKGTLYNGEGFRIYKGQYYRGERHGTGTSYFNEREPIFWRNQEFKIYEGQWKGGRYHGKGRIYLGVKIGGEDFVSHKGDFEEGKLVYGSHIGLNRVGENTRLQQQNERQILYIGGWLNGQYHGLGESFTYDSWGRNCLESSGEFEHGKFMNGNVYNIHQQVVEVYKDGIKQ